MPDGSLGIHWAKYWKAKKLEGKFGQKIKISHKFPESYRQLNPEINAYPNEVLSEFRTWFQETYLPQKYPNYVKNKLQDKSKLSILLEAVLPPSLESKALPI